MTHHFTITPLNTCRRRVAVLSVVLLIGWFVATPRQTFATTTRTWLPASGDWNVNGNWSGGSVPSSTDIAVIDNDCTALVPTGVLGTVNTLIVGSSGTGSLNITGGSLSGSSVGLGSGAGSLGSAQITSGTWTNGGLTVGGIGTGILNIDGGTMTNSSLVVISGKPEASGTVTITSGTFTTSTSLQVGYGSGALNINGGFVSNATASFGWKVNNNIGTGSATVTGGTWSNTTLIVGETGQGFLNISGGIVTSATTIIGRSGNGNATINSGTLATTNTLYIGYSQGGTGTMTIQGGYVSSGSSVIGSGGLETGGVTVTGGTWATSGGIMVGVAGGQGTLTLGGNGVATVGDGTGTLDLATYSNATGTLNLGVGDTAGTLNAGTVNGGPGTATVNFNHTGNYTFSPNLTGNLSVNKLGSGTTILNGSNNYTGSTTVSSGELDVNGSQVGASPVTVAAGGILGGSGTVSGNVAVNGTLKGTLHTGAISGSGLVSPGNSPGILTATSINPTGGMSFAFEFTLTNTNPIYGNALASGNDILHLTGASPFSDNLTADNLISIYLQSAVAGDSYLGGFFTGLSDVQLEAVIQNAKFAFFVEDDSNGTITFNGKTYSSISAALIGMGTTQVNGANFADGTVNGSVLKVTVVPEPCTWWMLTAGMVILICLKSPGWFQKKSEINPWLE